MITYPSTSGVFEPGIKYARVTLLHLLFFCGNINDIFFD